MLAFLRTIYLHYSLPFRLKTIKSSGHSHFDQEIAEKVFYYFRYLLWRKNCFLFLKFKCVINNFEHIKSFINGIDSFTNLFIFFQLFLLGKMIRPSKPKILTVWSLREQICKHLNFQLFQLFQLFLNYS